MSFSNHSKTLVSSLSKVAFNLGNELHRLITGTTPSKPNMTFVEELIEQILPCYLESANCPLFKAASVPGTKLPNQVLPMYVSVIRTDNAATMLTAQLLALLTSVHHKNLNAAQCAEKHLLWMAGYDFNGLCINATANYSSAISPAFIIEGE